MRPQGAVWVNPDFLIAFSELNPCGIPMARFVLALCAKADRDLVGLLARGGCMNLNHDSYRGGT
jgi:hypothetical protein